MKLDPTQIEAINFVKVSILEKIKVVALCGAGGTGKTSVLHALVKDPELAGKSIICTATTNKAASVMRKSISSAITMHSAVSKFIHTNLYKELETYFLCSGLNMTLNEEALEFLKNEQKDPKEILEKNSDVDDFFHNMEIDGYDPLIFSHYATAPYLGGAVIVDEASMLPTKSIYKKDEKGLMKLQTIGLDILKGIYDTVVIVGDDSQLPPISGTSSFDEVPSYHLTKNYRSEKDLLRLLDYARQGKSLELFRPNKGENIRIIRRLDDKYINASRNLKLDIAHIVFRNDTRRKITKRIRGSSGAPQEGEKIVYYGKNINDPENNDFVAKNEIGKYTKGMGEWEKHHEFVDYNLFDEYPSSRKYSKYRYGYALTAHSAQGSAFDHVIVHIYDIPGFIDVKTQVKWCYTACSRAKKSVTIVMGE